MMDIATISMPINIRMVLQEKTSHVRDPSQIISNHLPEITRLRKKVKTGKGIRVLLTTITRTTTMKPPTTIQVHNSRIIIFGITIILTVVILGISLRNNTQIINGVKMTIKCSKEFLGSHKKLEILCRQLIGPNCSYQLLKKTSSKLPLF